MSLVKFDRALAITSPARAVSNAMDQHRFEAVRMGRSEPEEICWLMVQARHHVASIIYYVNGVRTARSKAMAYITREVASPAQPAKSLPSGCG